MVLQAVEEGHGEIGVALGHHYPNDLCDWWPYMRHLAKEGFTALPWTSPGDSQCPEGRAAEDLILDVRAVAKRLRDKGTSTVLYMGGSMGGTVAFVAGQSSPASSMG